MLDRLAVLLMAYGNPNTLDEVEPYLTHIRGGRTPSREQLDDLKERYKRIGGHSPLLEITQRQASRLERMLRQCGLDARVYVGMKHWHPFIADTVKEILGTGISHLMGIPMAPHYSRLSAGGYWNALDEALAEQQYGIHADFVKNWHLQPTYLRAVARNIRRILPYFTHNKGPAVVFTAHSLPAKILAEGDPYAVQLHETSEKLATMLGLNEWSFAYQSASHTGEPWLGPDILEKLQQLHDQERQDVLIAPIGFVADHLEILYDIDIECTEFAEKHGMDVRRIHSLNDHPLLSWALTRLVLNAIS